jgi:ribosomal protein L23
MAQISTSVDMDRELTTFEVKGTLTADEIIKKVEEYYSMHPTKLVLWVMEHAVTAGITSEEIEKIILTAKKNSGSRKEGKTAIVGPKDIEYGLGRMYQAYADIESMPYEYKIFREVEDAKNWLGIE